MIRCYQQLALNIAELTRGGVINYKHYTLGSALEPRSSLGLIQGTKLRAHMYT